MLDPSTAETVEKTKPKNVDSKTLRRVDGDFEGYGAARRNAFSSGISFDLEIDIVRNGIALPRQLPMVASRLEILDHDRVCTFGSGALAGQQAGQEHNYKQPNPDNDRMAH